MKRQWVLFNLVALAVSFAAFLFTGPSAPPAKAAPADPTPGLQPLKMGVSPVAQVTLSPGAAYTILGRGQFQPPNDLVQQATFRWQGHMEVTAPASPSDIDYEFVIGVNSTPSCSSYSFHQRGIIPAGAIQPGATQDIPIDGFLRPPNRVNLYRILTPARDVIDYVAVCAKEGVGATQTTTISHPTASPGNIGSAFLTDLTSYPQSGSFNGDNPGIISCPILDSFASPVPLPEDGATWIDLTPATTTSCLNPPPQFQYDPGANGIVVMRGGMMKVNYPSTSDGTLEYVEYELQCSTDSSKLCGSSALQGVSVDPHSIDGVEIGASYTAQPLVNLLTLAGPYQQPGTSPLYIRLCATSCVSTNGGTSCNGAGASPPQVSWVNAQVDLLTKPY